MNTNDAKLNQDDLRKFQRVLLDMMSEVDRMCRKHDIKYGMIGGTLLGAVRHKGFIPWDDDVDFYMMRHEYEKFKLVCQRELDSNKYFLQDNTTDPYYRWGYARIRRRDSEFVRAGQGHMKMQTGIFLDIFIGDHVPDFYPLRLLHALYCFVLRKMLYSEAGIVTGKNALIRFWYRVFYRIPARFVFARLDKLARFWNARPGRYIRSLTFPTMKDREFGFPYRWYADTVDMEFEGRTFKAICGYEEYLRAKYGDYMALPPENKRHWHPAEAFRLPDEYADI